MFQWAFLSQLAVSMRPSQAAAERSEADLEETRREGCVRLSKCLALLFERVNRARKSQPKLIQVG